MNTNFFTKLLLSFYKSNFFEKVDCLLMGDISHHNMIYNMKSWRVFGAYGEISVTG